ncbi:MAG: DUF3634 family protein [Deltaproteobacteria bacterium]|nr:DUF3634 family protein [Deltaproteobacteria bacterium]
MTGPSAQVKPAAILDAICNNARVEALVLFGLAVVVILVLVLASRNVNLLFRLSIRAGEVVRLRGRVPKRLVRDIQDVVKLRPVPKAELRVVVRDKRPFVEASGDIDEHELQRLRNVVGLWETAKIRAAPYRSEGGRS